MKFARSWVGRHAITVQILALSVLVFTGLRAALMLRHVSLAEASVWELARVMWIGLRFDLLTAGIFVLPLAAHLTFVGDRWINSRISRVLLEFEWFVGLVFLPLMCVIEVIFFEEFETRLNYIAFEYLVYPTEVCCNIWQSYPVVPLFSAVAAFAVGLHWMIRRRYLPLLASPSSPLRRYGLFAALLAGIPGLWLTVDWSHTQISEDRVANECSGNGLYSFVYYAWTCRFDYEEFYLTIDEQEAAQRTRTRIAGSTDDVHAESQNPIDRTVTSRVPLRDLNVVIVLEESFGSEFVGVLGNTQALTPRFDALSKEGLLFDNFYATGNRTARALEAVLTSMPPLPTESILKRDHSERVFTLANVLEARGYRRLFMTGGRGLFDGVRRFMKANGFDLFLEQKDFIDPVFANAWGVSDEDLFHRAIEELDKLHDEGQPFLATLLTVSNHRPYTYPDGRTKPVHKNPSRENVVRYADWALGDFFERARRRPFFQNTIFVVLGDHGARVTGKQLFPMSSYRVPLLVILPDAARKGERVSTLASTIDVAPTIMGLLGGSYRSVFFGHDILSVDPARAFAVMQHNHDAALLDSQNRLVVLGSKKSAWGYRLDPATYDLVSMGFPDPEATEDVIALYQTANRLYYGRRCFPEESSAPPTVAAHVAPAETR